MQVIKIVIIIFIRTASVPATNPWIAIFLIPFILMGFAKSLIPGIPFISDSSVVSTCPLPDSVYSCTYSKHWWNGSNFYDTDNYFDFKIKAGQVEENSNNTQPNSDSNLNCNDLDENYVRTGHHTQAPQIGTCYRLYIETEASKQFKTVFIKIEGKSELVNEPKTTKVVQIPRSDFKQNGDKIYANLYYIVNKYKQIYKLEDESMVKIAVVD